jgi:DNA-binding MarR family transcriptional regulator
MPRPRREANAVGDAAEALSRIAPLTARWVERILAAHAPPLTPAQYLALTSIAGGDVFGADLARRAAVSPAAVSQLLAGLETSGLIERTRPTGDRRRQTLALSEQGRLVLDSARALLRSRLGELLGELPAPEIHALTRLLGGVEALLAGTAPPRRPHPPHPRR